MATDRQAILSLLRGALGQSEEQHETFFGWKHERNPFGKSPSWVATCDDEVVGFRTFLRWRFALDGEVIPAVRAVDTATHPDHRGRGIFRALTLLAVDELREEGVGFVFNTPNTQSRPGYLKMGWSVVGRLPVGVLPRSPASLARALRSRVPAERWSIPNDVGLPADEVLGPGCATGDLVPAPTPDGRLRTDRTVEYLRWRYGGFGPIAYRFMPMGPAGFVPFRLRRRGRILEAAIGDVLGPAPAGGAVRRTVSQVVRETGADVAVGALSGPLRWSLIPVPRAGPVVTTRPLARDVVPPAELVLSDIELL